MDAAELRDHLDGFTADLEAERITGFLPGGRELDVPLASEVAENLWVGGWPDPIVRQKFANGGQPLKHFAGVVDVYGEPYPLPAGPVYVRKPMQDWAGEPDWHIVGALASIVAKLRDLGPVLVHCQAGLNRSSLVASVALVHGGAIAEGVGIVDAIATIRERRSPLCLCNDAFERALLSRYA